MRLIQAAHAITSGDAASNQIFAMDQAFQELGYESAIYSNKFDSTLSDRVQPFSQLVPDEHAILIYHMTTGTSFTNVILRYPYSIVLYYHNITPARYFLGNAWGSFFKCIKGRYQLKKLKDKTAFAWAASSYSSQELNQLGFQHTSVLPILLNWDEYRQTPLQQELISTYQDGKLNILMVGRVTPHKKQDEAIRMVSEYKKTISDQIRLIIVGNHKANYGAKLRKLAAKLGVTDEILFTGKVTFADLCTYYRLSDLLLCLSEHEGFCVPLIESMIFDKPIVAYDVAAVPETVGGAGILLTNKQPRHMVQVIHQLMSSTDALQQLAMPRKKQLKALSHEILLKKMDCDIKYMSQLMQS